MPRPQTTVSAQPRAIPRLAMPRPRLAPDASLISATRSPTEGDGGDRADRAEKEGEHARDRELRDGRLLPGRRSAGLAPVGIDERPSRHRAGRVARSREPPRAAVVRVAERRQSRRRISEARSRLVGSAARVDGIGSGAVGTRARVVAHVGKRSRRNPDALLVTAGKRRRGSGAPGGASRRSAPSPPSR